MRKLCRLKMYFVLVCLVFVFFELPIMCRMAFLNAEIAQNERLNYGPAHEEYVSTYYELQAEKAEFKDQHFLASLPFFVRVTVYTVTIGSLFFLKDRIQKEKKREKIKKERRKLRYEEERNNQRQVQNNKSPVRVDLSMFI